MLAIRITGAMLYNLIQSSISNSILLIKYIGEASKNCDKTEKLYRCIEDNDLEFKINLVRNILISLKNEVESESNQLLLEGLKNIVEKIETSINDANKKIEEHKLKWFNSWRGLNIDKNINDLSKYSAILNERIRLFHWFT